jgi:hypothetical protein
MLGLVRFALEALDRLLPTELATVVAGGGGLDSSTGSGVETPKN